MSMCYEMEGSFGAQHGTTCLFRIHTSRNIENCKSYGTTTICNELTCLLIVEKNRSGFKRISTEEAKILLESNPELTIADIRNSESYNLGNIPHSINVNNKNIAQFLKDTIKEKPLLVYCYHGINSQDAADFFVKEGFKDVYSLDGGFSEFSKYM